MAKDCKVMTVNLIIIDLSHVINDKITVARTFILLSIALQKDYLAYISPT